MRRLIVGKSWTIKKRVYDTRDFNPLHYYRFFILILTYTSFEKGIKILSFFSTRQNYLTFFEEIERLTLTDLINLPSK